MFGRRLRTRLDFIHPKWKTTSHKSTEGQSENKPREFEVGDAVWMHNYRGVEKWITGVVISKSGPLSYVVQARNQKHRRHIDQHKSKENNSSECDNFIEFPVGQNATMPENGEQSPQELVCDTEPQMEPARPAGQQEQATYSSQYNFRRNRKPPEYLGH